MTLQKFSSQARAELLEEVRALAYPTAEAAALLESLIQNHPFLDGNKRTAVAAADVHLRMNGFELGGDSVEHHLSSSR